MSEALLTRLGAPGPKRILALDGGGVRGLLSLEFLARVEDVLRARTGRPDLVLADYFDLVGGTSTGAMIAGGLATGMEVAAIRELYLTAGREVFRRRRIRFWHALYDEHRLERVLEERFGDVTLGDDAIRTGLCLVTKRADTNSTWPLVNHPGGRYYASNRHIRLRDAIRASAAAPVMFRPAKIEIAPGQSGTFVDGAVSVANNPALLLLLVATLAGYPFHWPLGEDQILLVSVGTGVWERRTDALAMARANAFQWLAHLPDMLIQDAGTMTELLLQALSKTPTPWAIDREVGDLDGELWFGRPALSYVRYNARLEPDALVELGLSDLVPRLDSLRRLAGQDTHDDLVRIGRAEATRAVSPDHLRPAFDLPVP